MENINWKERVMKKKWESLKRRGLTKSKDKKENDARAKEAHGF